MMVCQRGPGDNEEQENMTKEDEWRKESWKNITQPMKKIRSRPWQDPINRTPGIIQQMAKRPGL
jgi:hypothetical protein